MHYVCDNIIVIYILINYYLLIFLIYNFSKYTNNRDNSLIYIMY